MKVRVRTLLAAGLALGALTAAATRAPFRTAVSTDLAKPHFSAEDLAGVAKILGLLAQPHSDDTVVDRTFGLSAAATARRQLAKPVSGYRDDCSGYVSAILSEEGLLVDGVVASIYAKAVENDAVHWDLTPIAGDLVFFDDTHDRDNNGRIDDDLTHIGIVIDVEPDGTVVFGQAGLSTGRGTGRLNLFHPSNRTNEDGDRTNSTLRNPRRGDPPGTVYLAGELFAGFARVDPSLDWSVTP